MDLNKLNSKVKIINNELPVEFFCKKRFKNYYVRGQMFEQLESISNMHSHKHLEKAMLRVFIFALVNKEYQCKFIDPIINWNLKDNLPPSKFHFKPEKYPDVHINLTEMGFYLSIFFGNTEKEFLKKMSKIKLDHLCIDDERPGAWDFGRDFENNPVNTENNPPIYVDYDDINLNKKDPYILDSIKKKKDIILLDIDILIDRSTSKEITFRTPEIITFIGERFYFAFTKYQRIGGSLESLAHSLFNDIYYNCNFHLMSRAEYEDTLMKIGFLCFYWQEHNEINSEFLSLLNNLRKEKDNQSNILKIFCFKFYDNLIDVLLNNKRIKQCQFCDDYFKYLKVKKYCSLKSEGKNCGTKARNRRFYKDHKETIKPKARKVTRELRQFYKEKGIIK